MRRTVLLVLDASLLIASEMLIALALSEDSYHGLGGAAVLLLVSLAWWWENWGHDDYDRSDRKSIGCRRMKSPDDYKQTFGAE